MGTPDGDNKDAFEEPLAKLQELDAVCIAFSNMFSLTPQSSTSPEAYVKAFEECESKVTWFDQKTLGSAFQVKYCMAKASLACLYGDYEKFGQEFESKSPAMQDLAQKMGRNQLEALVVPEVEGRILLTLRGLKQEDVNALATGQVTSNMTEVINLCDAVVAHCKSPMGEFLAESLLDGCMLARNILSRDDVAATATAVQAGEQAKANSEADGTLVVGGAVEGFFLEHALGRSLFDLAVDHVKTGEKQGKVQESLQALATGLETLTMAGSSQGLRSFDIEGIKRRPRRRQSQACYQSVGEMQQCIGQLQEGFRPEDPRAAGSRDQSKPVRAFAPWLQSRSHVLLF